MRKINKKYPIIIGLLLAVAALALIFLPKRTAGDTDGLHRGGRDCI